MLLPVTPVVLCPRISCVFIPPMDAVNCLSCCAGCAPSNIVALHTFPDVSGADVLVQGEVRLGMFHASIYK